MPKLPSSDSKHPAQFENGMITQLYGTFKYTVDAGRVTALRTFWETDQMSVYPPFAQRGD